MEQFAEGMKLLTESSESTMSKTGIGKDLVGYLKNDVEPAIAREGQQLMRTINPQTGVLHPPDEAIKLAREKVFNAAFGKNRVGLMPVLAGIKAQGGDIHAAHVADALNVFLKDENKAIPWRSYVANKLKIPIKISSAYTSPSEKGLERTVKSVSSRMFLPLISIPHAFQAPLNSLLINGWGDTLRALIDFSGDLQGAKKLALDSGALTQDLVQEHLNAMRKTSMFNRLLDPLRGVFSLERRLGIQFSAVGGKWSAIRAAQEFAQTGSKRAELQLKLLGLDPALVQATRGVLSQQDIEKAAFRAASEIMGMRSPLETPYMWEQNAMARLTTLYKHYGFRQARLIKDALKRGWQGEGVIGAAKIMTALGLAFPIAGELIKGAEGAVTLKNPWTAERKKQNLAGNEYLDAFANAGGFGMMYSITRAARHNHLGGYLMGPHISTAADLAQDVMNLRGKSVARDVLRRMGLPGRALSDIIVPPKKKESE